MERNSKYCCLILPDTGLKAARPINPSGSIELINAADLEEAVTIAGNNHIDCIILQANQKSDSVCHFYTELTGQFPAIPILIILNSPLIELSCRLGRLGAKYVVSGTDIKKTEKLLQRLLEKRHLRGGGTFFPDKFAA